MFPARPSGLSLFRRLDRPCQSNIVVSHLGEHLGQLGQESHARIHNFPA